MLWTKTDLQPREVGSRFGQLQCLSRCQRTPFQTPNRSNLLLHIWMLVSVAAAQLRQFLSGNTQLDSETFSVHRSDSSRQFSFAWAT